MRDLKNHFAEMELLADLYILVDAVPVCRKSVYILIRLQVRLILVCDEESVAFPDNK